MKQPVLIIVLGTPASGKSTLAKKLSHELTLPLVIKDDLKVMMFDAYGWDDREASVKAGRAAFDMLDYFAEGQIRAGNSLIIESPFNSKFASPRFRAWQETYGVHFIQICCTADPDIIRQRFKQRAATDKRHVSYIEGEAGLKNLETLLDTAITPLDVEGEIIHVDTTDFSAINEAEIAARVRKLL